MWDERYSVAEYVYGTEPNTFLVEHAGRLEGPVLSLAEGEGRNGVFLASLGLEVHGVDASPVGLAKAQALARARGVSLHTEVADLADFEPEPERYGAVISIWAHLPSALRARVYPRIERCLRPGGLVVLEAYSLDQPAYGTGGPRDADSLMSIAKLERELPNLEPILLRELVRGVQEGALHGGLSAVVQFVGRRR